MVSPRQWLRPGMALAVAGLGALAAPPDPRIPVPNGSFEGPSTTFVTTRVDSWQESPKPDDYLEGGGFQWDQLTGTFRNTLPGTADHLFNIDGNQALYLFALPGVGVFQDVESKDFDDPVPRREFNVVYRPGQRYTLSARVVGLGGNMLEGVPLELSLYYVVDVTNRIPVVTRVVTNSQETFADRNHFVGFSVASAPVSANDPWAGRPLGIRIQSIVSDEQKGGYWDVDDVRLEAESTLPAITPLRISRSGDGLKITFGSRTGYAYRLQRSRDLGSWEDAGEILIGNDTTLEFTASGSNLVFDRVEALGLP
jgi:hypothetical protein